MGNTPSREEQNNLADPMVIDTHDYLSVNRFVVKHTFEPGSWCPPYVPGQRILLHKMPFEIIRLIVNGMLAEASDNQDKDE
jgi:hypothetical protein